MTTETIHVPEIHCGHCKNAIEGTLNPLDGVSRAEVNVEDRTVTVEYDEQSLDRGRIVDEIVELGYELPA